jgi:hypothetical protein
VALKDAPSPFAGGPSKWDDPNFDPTKDTIDTDVPLHLAAYDGKIDEVHEGACALGPRGNSLKWQRVCVCV